MARLIKPLTLATAKEPWAYLHAIADSANPEIVKAFLASVMKVRNGFNRRRFERLLEMYDFDRVLKETNWELIAATELQPEIASTLRDVLESAARFTPLPIQAEIAWDILDPKALDWIRNEAGTLITNITKETLQAVRETITRGFQEGKGTAATADTLRDIIGMNSRQAATYEKYAADLAERGISATRQTSLLETYQRKLIKDRANLISRTETIKAANEGWRQGIQKAVDDNLLDPNVWEIGWIVTQDDRRCERCQSMRGKRRPINGAYIEGEYAGTSGPPGHPACRCSERVHRISERLQRAA
jgi:hypothetical protein